MKPFKYRYYFHRTKTIIEVGDTFPMNRTKLYVSYMKYYH